MIQTWVTKDLMDMAEAFEVAGRLLVVDDDVSVLDALCEYLGKYGYAVVGVESGIEMDRALASQRFDLVILDVMLPVEDGLSICQRLRGRGPPVLMLSAMGDVTDRIVGLEVGADDYLAKPFNPRELLARVKAVLRRHNDLGAASEPGRAVFSFAGWLFEPDARELQSPAGAKVSLTSGEQALLRVFVDRPRRILSRDQLLDLARGATADSYDRAIDLQVSRLRRKLDDGSGAELIETVRGEGYRFVPSVQRR